jgi:hypothetical protein
MFSALNEQDVLCRVFGDCLAGDPTREGLDAIGCKNIEPEAVQKLDSIDAIPELLEVGTAVAEMKVKQDHFARFPPRG